MDDEPAQRNAKDDKEIFPEERSRMRTVKYGADFLGVSTYALYRKIQNGEIPAYRFGRKVLINLDEVLARLATKK